MHLFPTAARPCPQHRSHAGLPASCTQRTHTLSLLVPLLRGHGELFQAVHAPARPILFRGAEVLLPDLHFRDFCQLAASCACGCVVVMRTVSLWAAPHFHLSAAARDELSSVRLMMVGARASDFDPQHDPVNLPMFFRPTSDEMLAYLQARAQSMPAQAPAAVVPSVASCSVDTMQWTSAQLCVLILILKCTSKHYLILSLRDFLCENNVAYRARKNKLELVVAAQPLMAARRRKCDRKLLIYMHAHSHVHAHDMHTHMVTHFAFSIPKKTICALQFDTRDRAPR